MRNPLHFALVVGISCYPGGYPKLLGPENDANEFAKWVTSSSGGGVLPKNVARCITTASATMRLEDARPTKETIDFQLLALRDKAITAYNELPEEQRAQAKAETSRLYIYLAGHGIMPGGGTAALLDARAQRTRCTNLEIRSYEDWFRRDGTFAEVCIFADCCRNFELLAPGGGPDFNEPGELGGSVFSLVGYATSEGEQAFEESGQFDPEVSSDDRRGYFSRALIDGLEGKATHPRTGYVTDASLQTYVSAQVMERTANRPVYQRQAIDMLPNPGHPMTFGPKREVPYYRVVIRFRPELSGDIDLVAPDGSLSDRWRVSDGPWTKRLHDGLWTVQHAGTDRDTTGFDRNGTFGVIGADLDVQL